jgi:hypothetical protein
MRKINLIFLFCFCVTTLLSSCAERQQNLDSIDTTNLGQLESIKVSARSPSGNSERLSNLRVKLLKDSAMSIGAQGGLAWSSGEINSRMHLDRK